jgi:GMP synthase-like glutamine amidotransferase
MILIVKHVAVEGPGIILDFFENTKWSTKIIDLGKGDALPSNLQNIEGIILLGGPMNVYEEERYNFLKKENDFLKKVLELNIPLLGVCLGAQLIAKATGATVAKASESEIGWGRVLLTDMGQDDPLFSGLGPTLEVFQWHDDAFKIPRGGVLLAHSQICAQAFRVGESAYGLQFHIEVTPQMVDEWFEYYSGNGELSDEVVRKTMVLEAYKKRDDFFKQGEKLLFNFSRIIESSRVLSR